MKQNTEVRFEVPEYKRVTDERVDGREVSIEYDSSFGGTQVVEGQAEVVRELESRGFVHYLVVGDRKINNGRVYSGVDGRMLGEVDNVTVQMDSETAIEWVADEWYGHDVDTHDDEIYVQFWSGQLNDDMTQEEWFNHSESIRFKHA